MHAGNLPKEIRQNTFWLDKLYSDLNHHTWGSEIISLLNTNPVDVSLWLKVRQDPAYHWELLNSGNPPDASWLRWSQGKFFAEVTATGRKFEQETVLNALKARNSNSDYAKLKDILSGKNLDEYDMYSQVQLKYDGEEYFVADQVFIKWGKSQDGITDEIKDIVIVENKLSSGTDLTPNQMGAKASNSNLIVRSRSSKLESPRVTGSASPPLQQGLEITVKPTWVKIWDSMNGDVITDIKIF
ncbi:hypothetical protein [Haliscomenobacter sp.]|uniref:hypothetical protein n=1 Tax=Haliscomenobacter sp. TaxID=2717303 RepID=UPI0035945045